MTCKSHTVEKEEVSLSGEVQELYEHTLQVHKLQVKKGKSEVLLLSFLSFFYGKGGISLSPPSSKF